MSSRISEQSVPRETSGPIAAPAWAGKRVGRFRLISELGRGAMGRVFRAEDTLLQRHVALKVLPKVLKRGKKTVAVERLISEARAAATLDHPHVVTVYEINESGGVYYIAMELLEGGSLRDIVKAAGPIDCARACLLCADAAEALAQAHSLGIIHRDIKPANLMLTRSGRCKVADFGLARMDDAGDLGSAAESVGTPQFIAPELLKGMAASARSDIYSLGATLWYLLSGHPPFEADTPTELLRKHLEEPLPNLASLRPDLDHGLLEAIGRAMSKRPADRFESAAQFEKVLRVYTIAAESRPDAPPVTGRRIAAPKALAQWIRSPAALGTAAAAVLIIAVISISTWRATRGRRTGAQEVVRVAPVTTVNVSPAPRPEVAVEDPIALASVGMQYARQGRFGPAAESYQKALQLNPTQPLNYYYRGCLAAYVGDEKAYRATCKAMYERFAASRNVTVRDKTAKTCALLADSGVDPKDLLTLSDSLSASNSPELFAWFSMCRGMALYRSGQYQQCIDVMEGAKSPDRITRAPVAGLFQAMSQWRLGQRPQAQVALKEAVDRLNQSLAKPGVDDLGRDGLEDWLICQAVRAQAEALINQ